MAHYDPQTNSSARLFDGHHFGLGFRQRSIAAVEYQRRFSRSKGWHSRRHRQRLFTGIGFPAFTVELVAAAGFYFAHEQSAILV